MKVAFWTMRHAETLWNAQGLLQGQGDSPLTARGEAESLAAGRLLLGEGIRHVLSSDLGRAVRTAAIVARALGGLPARTDPAWRELDVGDLEGHPRETVETLPGYRRDPGFRMPGGECLLELRERVLLALGRLGREPEPTLLVTHGGPLRILLAAAEGLPPERMLEARVPRAMVARFHLEDGHLQPPVFIRG